MKSSIFYDLEIGSGVIIGANTLVNRSVEPNQVVAGIPFKVLRKRVE
jgi:acetyltransferase-like isoleucine patch superfamily enzyme